MIRTLNHLRVGLNHPRSPEPSRIELSLMPADRKSDRIDVYAITEDQALALATECLNAVRVIRSIR